MRTLRFSSAALALGLVVAIAGCGRDDTTPGQAPGAANLVLPTSLETYAPDVSSFCNLLVDCCACTGLTHGSTFEVLDAVGYQAGSPTQKQVVSLAGLEPIVIEVDQHTDPDAPEARPLIYVGGCETAGQLGAVWMYTAGTSTPVDPSRVGRLVLPAGQYPMSLRLHADGTLFIATLDTNETLRIHRATDSDADDVPDDLDLFADASTFGAQYDSILAQLEAAPFDVVDLGDVDEVAVHQSERYLFRFVDSNQDGSADMLLRAPRFSPALSTFLAGHVPDSTRVWVDAGALSDRSAELWRVDAQGAPLTLAATATTGSGGRTLFDVSPALVAGTRLAVYVPETEEWGVPVEVEASLYPSVMPLTAVDVDEGATIDIYIPQSAAGSATIDWEFYDSDTWPLELVSKSATVADLGSGIFRVTIPTATEAVRLSDQVLRISIPELAEDATLPVRVDKPE